jgi:hypothetical protein
MNELEERSMRVMECCEGQISFSVLQHSIKAAER